MHQRLVSLYGLAGFLLLSFLVAPMAFGKIPERVSLQKRAAVTVYVEDARGRKLVEERAFFVHEDGVVAAGCRVVQKWLAAVDNKLVVDMDGALQFPVSEMVSSRCVKGHALFKVPAQGVPPVVLAPGYKPKKGERVFVAGPPAGGDSGLMEVGVKTVGNDQFTLSLPLSFRSAGSPVFSERGTVIGIVVPVAREDKNTATVTPAKYTEAEIVRYKKILKRLAALPQEPSAVPSTVFPRVRDDVRLPERLAALERARQRVQEEQSSPDALIALGAAYEDLKMYAEAIEAYERILSTVPHFTDAHVRRGTAFYRLGRYTQAVEAYKQAITAAPGCPPCYSRLGSVLIILSEYDGAIEAFREELKLEPGNSDAYFNIGLAYFLKGDYLNAVEQYSILKELDSKRAESLKELLY